jgi:hypothetical protein
MISKVTKNTPCFGHNISHYYVNVWIIIVHFYVILEAFQILNVFRKTLKAIITMLYVCFEYSMFIKFNPSYSTSLQ